MIPNDLNPRCCHESQFMNLIFEMNQVLHFICHTCHYDTEFFRLFHVNRSLLLLCLVSNVTALKLLPRLLRYAKVNIHHRGAFVDVSVSDLHMR
jgi:hypothetical protein